MQNVVCNQAERRRFQRQIQLMKANNFDNGHLDPKRKENKQGVCNQAGRWNKQIGLNSGRNGRVVESAQRMYRGVEDGITESRG